MNLSAARLQLFLLQVSGLVVLLSLLVAGAYELARNQLYSELDDRLTLMARAVAFSVEHDAKGHPEFEEALFLARRQNQLPVGSEAAVQWLNMRGAVLVSEGALRITIGAPRADFEFSTQDAPLARVYTHLAQSQIGPFGYARVGLSLLPLQQRLRRLARNLTLVGLATLLLTGIASWWWTGRVLRPIKHSYEELSAFSGAIAHELRTPLAALRLNSEVLAKRLESYAPQQTRTAVEDLNAAAADLAETVNALLILAPRDNAAGEILTSIPLEKILEEVVAETQTVPPRIAVTPGPAVSVRGHAGHLRMMLRNVIANALRYTDGPVSLHWRARAGWAEVEVSDTGPGLRPEEQARVFEPFWRGERSRARHLGGTGLGLSIVKALAQVQGGSVAVSSRAGEGSTFTLRFPIAPEEG